MLVNLICMTPPFPGGDSLASCACFRVGLADAVEDAVPSTRVRLDHLLARQPLVRDDDLGAAPPGVEVDGDQRALIAGERRVPGEDDAARARDFLVRARVRDRALGRVHDDLELAADARVELHVRAYSVERSHPGGELAGIQP